MKQIRWTIAMALVLSYAMLAVGVFTASAAVEVTSNKMSNKRKGTEPNETCKFVLKQITVSNVGLEPVDVTLNMYLSAEPVLSMDPGEPLDSFTIEQLGPGQMIETKDNRKEYKLKKKVDPSVLGDVQYIHGRAESTAADVLDFFTQEVGQCAPSSTTNVTKAITSTIKSTSNGVTSIGSDSSSAGTFAAVLGMDASTATQGALADSLAELTNTLISDDLNVVTETGTTITINPSPARVCAEWAQALGTDVEDLEGCAEIADEIVVTINTESATSGTAALRIGTDTFLTVRYAPDTVTFETDLNAVKNTLLATSAITNPGEDPDLPATMTGIISLTMQNLGPDHGRSTFGITQAITLEDDGDGLPLSVTVAPSDMLFEVEANGVTQEARSELALAPLQGMFTVEDDLMNPIPVDLDIAGITFLANINGNGDNLTLSNVGLGNAPITLDVGGEEAVTLSMDSAYGASVNGATGTVTVSDPVQLDLLVNDIQGLVGFQGSFFFNTPGGTMLTSVGDDTNDIFRVDGGSVSVVGDGDFSRNLFAPIDSCFTPGSYEAVACP